MKFVYDPFVIRRTAEGRIFWVNPTMPFDMFIECFRREAPFFLVSQLEDGRIAITPNALVIQSNFLFGHGLENVLPRGYEYVTLKEATYPLFITAHPVANLDEWLKKFERWVPQFANQTLADFVGTSHEIVPLQKVQKMQQKAYKKEFIEQEEYVG